MYTCKDNLIPLLYSGKKIKIKKIKNKKKTVLRNSHQSSIDRPFRQVLCLGVFPTEQLKCLFSQQAKFLLKETPRAAGRGKKTPPFSIVLQRFLSLKGGEKHQNGVQKDVVFSHWLCSITYISPCPIGVLEVEMYRKFYGFFALLFLRLSHHSSHSFSIS